VTDTSWATQLLGADTLSASRAVLNSNFNAARRLSVASIDNTDSPYTTSDVADVVSVDASSGAVSVTLDSSVVGDVVYVTKRDSSANAITVSATTGTIDGASSVSITTQYETLTFCRIGASAWAIL
jgi:hypothetical protein